MVLLILKVLGIYLTLMVIWIKIFFILPEDGVTDSTRALGARSPGSNPGPPKLAT